MARGGPKYPNKVKAELKVSLSNFAYNLFDRVPIKFHYDDHPFTYYLDVDVPTFSDLGGYWYLDDCQGTVWTIKIPKEIMALVKAEGSPYKRTKCGYWTVDYKNFELLANPGFYDDTETFKDWIERTRPRGYDGPDDNEYDGWNVFKAIRVKARKWLDS